MSPAKKQRVAESSCGDSTLAPSDDYDLHSLGGASTEQTEEEIPLSHANRFQGKRFARDVVVAAPASGSQGASPVAGEVPVSENVGELVCLACDCQTTIGTSQPYGKNAFNRRCNDCCSAYRCRMSLVSKEKLKGKTTSKDWWDSLTKPQQKDWYKKEKRKNEGNKGCHRNIGVEVTQHTSHNEKIYNGR